MPGASTTGVKADGALLAVSGASGAVAVALNHMHRYEPQELRLQADGNLTIDVVNDTTWLANHQGVFATLAVSALPTGPSRTELDSQLWAPLNHPLRAWPDDQWFASSETTQELPTGTLPTELEAYDTLVEGVLNTTLQEIDNRGIAGLMTFGVYPRYWANPLYADELDCDGDDPTPADDWDDAFWCATWTDYHNTIVAAPTWAMRSGQVEWLDEIASPGALRTLHTQIIQCAPGDGFFYCGQAPCGYGAYRTDNNGSHAYFDNLILYYWLTGDETVLKVLEPGANSMREFLCPGRGSQPPGPACAATEPIVDPWADLNGRTASQWYAVFRLLGLASDDPSYLDGWAFNTARWLTQYYAEPMDGGIPHGFMVPSGQGSFDYVDGPGTYYTAELWMVSLYDLDLVHRLAVDSEDQALGDPQLTPSATIDAWARTLEHVSTLSPWSNGGAGAPWPSWVRFTFSGDRIGGTLVEIAEEIDGDGDGTPCEICGDDDGGLCLDLCLWDTGKATMAATLMRAADSTGSTSLWDLGESFTLFGLNAAVNDPQPLGKFMGEYLGRLHAGVARLAQGSGGIFADGFESGNTSAWSATVP